MGEELYVNKNGWKCVKSQLAKTDGRDPIEYERTRQTFQDDPATMKTALKALKVKAKEYAEDDA